MEYIKMYRGVLSPILCQHMIDTYEKLWLSLIHIHTIYRPQQTNDSFPAKRG